MRSHTGFCANISKGMQIEKKMQQAIKEPILAPGGGKQSQYLCPDCKASVYFRRRAGWTDHYCHKPYATCTTKLAFNRVSLEHELGKKLLGDRLSQLFPDAEIKIEHGFDERRRIADVAAVKDGAILAAYECQISPILVRGKTGLEERTRDYLDAGFPVTWWFGTKSLSATIRNWCVEFFGKGSWEVIDHPQVRLEGYVAERKKEVSNFLGNVIVDCLGLDKLEELIKEKLLQSIETADTQETIKLSKTRHEIQKRKSAKNKLKLFESDEYWIKFYNQILYILRQANEPLREEQVTRKAAQLFELDDEDWEETELSVYPQIGGQDGELMPCWKWLVGYSICLNYLVEQNLATFSEDSCEEYTSWVLSPSGLEKAQVMDFSTLPFKNNAVPEESKSASPLPAPEAPKRRNLLPRNYTEKFMGQVLSLFKEKPMTRQQLYQEAEKKFDFADEDKVLINEDGGRSFPLWEQVYSRTVDRLIKNNFLEYCESDRHIRANKRCQITQLGIKKLKELEPEKSKNGSSNGSLPLLMT